MSKTVFILFLLVAFIGGALAQNLPQPIPSNPSRTLPVIGVTPGQFAYVQDTVADVTNDGIDELIIVLSPVGSVIYSVNVIDGAQGTVINTFNPPAPSSTAFGFSSISLGDVNGNNVPDIALVDAVGGVAGTVYVFEITGNLLYQFNDPQGFFF